MWVESASQPLNEAVSLRMSLVLKDAPNYNKLVTEKAITNILPPRAGCV